jgi:hypothetical protein
MMVMQSAWLVIGVAWVTAIAVLFYIGHERPAPRLTLAARLLGSVPMLCAGLVSGVSVLVGHRPPGGDGTVVLAIMTIQLVWMGATGREAQVAALACTPLFAIFVAISVRDGSLEGMLRVWGWVAAVAAGIAAAFVVGRFVEKSLNLTRASTAGKAPE